MSDAAIAAIVTGLVTITTMVTGFLTLLIKLKYAQSSTEDMISDNTEITKAGTAAAVETAKSAVEAAADTKQLAEGINKKLNGGVDSAIEAAVAPLRDKMEEVTQYVHKRNHEIIDVINTYSLKVDVALDDIRRTIKAGAK